jgi:hypothetical protein
VIQHCDGASTFRLHQHTVVRTHHFCTQQYFACIAFSFFPLPVYTSSLNFLFSIQPFASASRYSEASLGFGHDVTNSIACLEFWIAFREGLESHFVLVLWICCSSPTQHICCYTVAASQSRAALRCVFTFVQNGARGLLFAYTGSTWREA